MTFRSISIIFIGSALLAGCEKDVDTAKPDTTSPVIEATQSPPADSSESQRVADENDDCAPLRELTAMDNRRPVPLQPMMAWHQKQNMMEHLVAIQRITDGLAREDWAEVDAGAALIESSPQMQQMCQHMGAGAEGFTEMALDFHRQADAIGVAADKKDKTAALKATANTLQACTSCHATFRQEVVDAATWQTRTGSAHQPSMEH